MMIVDFGLFGLLHASAHAKALMEFESSLIRLGRGLTAPLIS
jgi:hypothetical protein